MGRINTRIVYSDRLLNLISIFFKVEALAFFPFIVLRKEYPERINRAVLINHEKIHIEQQRELYVVGFYVLYAYYFLVNLIKCKNALLAYRNIPFEKEAYLYAYKSDYLLTRYKKSWKIHA